MAVQAANPFGAFLEGRQARQDEQYGQTRNALAQMELDQAPRDIANRNALAARQQEQYSQEQIARSLEQTASAAMRIAQSPNPRGELQANREFAANLMKQHPELAQMGDDDLKQYMGWIAGEAQSKLGIAPAQPKTPEAFTLGAGQTRYGPDGKPIASAPVSNEMTPYQKERLRIERDKLNRPEKSTGAFRPLTMQEVADAGLPPGTSAQVNERTGQINVLSKAPKPVASEEDSAAQKLDAAMNTLSAIRDVKDAIGWNTTGVGGQILGSVAGTDAADMAANIDTIKANVGFDRLQMMRDASKTGGALGGIAVQELNMLQSTIASLNTKQSGPQLKKNVEKVEAQYTKAVNAYRKAMGLPSMEDESTASGPQPGTIEDGYRFKGGNPADQSSWEKL